MKQLLSTTTNQDGTLDSRNDFDGDWLRPQNQVETLWGIIVNNTKFLGSTMGSCELELDYD